MKLFKRSPRLIIDFDEGDITIKAPEPIHMIDVLCGLLDATRAVAQDGIKKHREYCDVPNCETEEMLPIVLAGVNQIGKNLRKKKLIK